MQIEAVLCRAAARKDARQCENSPKSHEVEFTSSHGTQVPIAWH